MTGVSTAIELVTSFHEHQRTKENIILVGTTPGSTLKTITSLITFITQLWSKS